MTTKRKLLKEMTIRDLVEQARAMGCEIKISIEKREREIKKAKRAKR